MRSSKSRSRGNKNRSNRPTGGNIVNRVFDSSGPDGKVRGTPQQIIEKYSQLHRDAQLSGDRVAAENFAQHAEHYLRMLADAQREIDKVREEQEEQNRQRQAERDRERAARLKAQEDAAGGTGGGDGEPDSGLVETPEERAGQSNGNERQGDRSGGRQDELSGDRSDDRSGQAPADQGEPAEASAAADEQPARKPRRPRRPRNKPSDDGSGGTPDSGSGSAAAAAE